MDTQSISLVAQESAKRYYDYLSDQNAGLDEIGVRDIDCESGFIKLHLDKSPYSIDEMEYVISGQKYSIGQILPIQYDHDKKILFVKVREDILLDFNSIDPCDISIVSDLKFLIKRVENWYAKNGDYVYVPIKMPMQLDQALNLPLSVEQSAAVESIFSNPFTYVWGAPGTGKTRYVLAEALLRYYKAGQRVAVFAPTNNAIEQVLYGVIDTLKEAGVDLNNVIRLGTPSKEFVNKYPEVCEEAGVAKIISKHTQQIKLLNKIIEYRGFKQRLTHVKMKSTLMFHAIERTQVTFSQVKQSTQKLTKEFTTKKMLLDKTIAQVQTLQANIQEQKSFMESSRFKITKVFSPSTLKMQEGKLATLELSLSGAIQSQRVLTTEIEKLDSTINEKQTRCVELNENIENDINSIRRETMESEKLKSITSTLNAFTVSDVRVRLDRVFEESTSFCLKTDALYKEYDSMSIEDIKLKIEEIQLEIDQARSKMRRVEQALIVASTVDTYLSRFSVSASDDDETKPLLNVKHIFLDEAGYCGLIKGLTLFANDCPVTFLGDHMQLPPICEMKDSLIKGQANMSVCMWAQSALFADEVFSKPFESIHRQYIESQAVSFTGIVKSDLLATYRFGNNLAKALNDFVYESGFYSAWPQSNLKIDVIDAKRSIDADKRQNRAEVDAIVSSIDMLPTSSYAILAPYKNQIRLLSQKLPSLRNKILTVHASQGREWDTVILSVVDTSDMFFTDSSKPQGKKVINTAVSRAKKRLIIVCDSAFWMNRQDQLIGRIVSMGLSQGALTE